MYPLVQVANAIAEVKRRLCSSFHDTEAMLGPSRVVAQLGRGAHMLGAKTASYNFYRTQLE